MEQVLKRCRKSQHRIADQLPAGTGQVALDGSFSGYASIFDAVDQGRDAVARGAFSASLREKGAKGARMLFQHDPASPIGVWDTIAEDHKGLFVEGRITRGVRRGEEVLELMRAGAIDGLSIGFKTRRARSDRSGRVRWIVSADLWEISVVTFPLLDTARIASVKFAHTDPRNTGACANENRPSESDRSSRFQPWLTAARSTDTFGCRQDSAAAHSLQQKICRATRLMKTRN